MTDPAQGPTPQSLVAELRDLLNLEQIDTDLFRGPRQPDGIGRIYGGQVIAQALIAATRSSEPDRIAHSLHAYFMRPGDEELPVMYRVKRDYDGGSFSTRRVVAFQNGTPILSMSASFQRLEDGLSHRPDRPQVADPETLPDDLEMRRQVAALLPEPVRARFLRPRAFEMRMVDGAPWLSEPGSPPRQSMWFRLAAPLEGEPEVHRAMLAYISDLFLLSTAIRPHGINWLGGGMQVASLDHAVWLHDDVDLNDWLLYALDSPWSGRGRGFARGKIFARDGRLVASVAQEGLMRQRRPR